MNKYDVRGEKVEISLTGSLRFRMVTIATIDLLIEVWGEGVMPHMTASTLHHLLTPVALLVSIKAEQVRHVYNG